MRWMAKASAPPPSIPLPLQLPSPAAAVVALQPLRQEMAAAWAAPSPAQQQPWLSEAALALALPCLEHGSADGWQNEAGVLERADVQAAALSLLRWVALREASAPRGLLPPPAAQRLLQRDLLPLQACVLRLLGMQASVLGSSGSAAAEQAQLDGYLAAQRLHEALECAVEQLQRAAAAAGA